MTTEPPTPRDPFVAAERALTDAGISFTVVDRCPASRCPACSAAAAPAAAA